MGRSELVASGNLVKTYSAQARIVPSAQLLGDRSTWPPLRRALFNDMGREFTPLPSRPSERGVPLRPKRHILKGF